MISDSFKIIGRRLIYFGGSFLGDNLVKFYQTARLDLFPSDPIELVLVFFKFELRKVISDNFKIVGRRLIHF